MSEKENDKRAVAMAQAIKAITDNWTAQVELQRAFARLARVKYLALIAEGFTEEQALQLVKW